MEEHLRNLVLLAALKDGLLAVLLIELFVLRADAARGGIEHDVHLGENLGHGARDGDARGLERFASPGERGIQLVGHAFVPQRLDGECRRGIDDADQLHVTLQLNAVCKPLTDDAVAGNQNLDHV